MYLISIIVSLISLSSCNSSDKTVKNLDVEKGVEIIDFTNIKSIDKEILLSEIAEKIDYIPLEFNKESILGERGVSEVRLNDNYIFIGYFGSIKQFDTTGKYIRDVYKVGRGPGETFKRDFIIDNDSSKVYVYSNFNHTIQEYNFQGNFLRKLSNPIINGSEKDMFYFNRKIVLNYSYWDQPQNHITAIDLDKNEIDFVYKNYYNYVKPQTRGYGTEIQIKETTFQELNGQFLFKELCCDTLFQTKDFSTIKPEYIFKLGNQKVTYPEYSDWTYVIKSLESGKILIADFYLTNASIIILIARFNDKTLNWIIGNYNKLSGQMIFTDNKILRNDIDNGPDIDLIKSFSTSRVLTLNGRNYLCYLIWPVDLMKLLDSGKISEQTSMYPEKTRDLINMIRSLKIDDNPVLMKVTLK